MTSKTKCKKDDKMIEETTSCDTKERAKNMQEYEAMLMNFIFNDIGGVNV